MQFGATTDVEANAHAITRLVTEAAGSPAAGPAGPNGSAGPVGTLDEAHLVVLPEASMYDFGEPGLPLGPVAQRLDGPFVSLLAGLAGRLRVTIIAGMFEASYDDARPYNSVVVLDPNANLVATYRKTPPVRLVRLP